MLLHEEIEEMSKHTYIVFIFFINLVETLVSLLSCVIHFQFPSVAQESIQNLNQNLLLPCVRICIQTGRWSANL